MKVLPTNMQQKIEWWVSKHKTGKLNAINKHRIIFYVPILPIFIPLRAKALKADCAPGPGVLVLRYRRRKIFQKIEYICIRKLILQRNNK